MLREAFIFSFLSYYNCNLNDESIKKNTQDWQEELQELKNLENSNNFLDPLFKLELKEKLLVRKILKMEPILAHFGDEKNPSFFFNAFLNFINEANELCRNESLSYKSEEKNIEIKRIRKNLDIVRSAFLLRSKENSKPAFSSIFSTEIFWRSFLGTYCTSLDWAEENKILLSDPNLLQKIINESPISIFWLLLGSKCNKTNSVENEILSNHSSKKN